MYTKSHINHLMEGGGERIERRTPKKVAIHGMKDGNRRADLHHAWYSRRPLSLCLIIIGNDGDKSRL